MSSAFCSLEDAFVEPAMMPGKKKKSSKNKEYTVPESLSGSPANVSDNNIPEPMRAPPGTSSGLGDQPEAGGALQDFFPLPGKTAQADDWAKAFMLDPSNIPAAKPDGSVSVAGKSTLWRNIPTPVVEAVKSIPTDIQQRLDALTRQLESLTVVASPMQSTAELFLFVAIGLLFILALDTLLRCATTIAVSKMAQAQAQVGGFGRRWRN